MLELGEPIAFAGEDIAALSLKNATVRAFNPDRQRTAARAIKRDWRRHVAVVSNSPRNDRRSKNINVQARVRKAMGDQELTLYFLAFVIGCPSLWVAKSG
jgi:hypothetical protein